MRSDLAYANAAFIAGGAEYPARWARDAASFRAAVGARGRLGLAYGPGAAQRFDLFLPEAVPRGALIFVHGGYWLEGGREYYSHLAAGALARGWACALPSYTLAPSARITAMVAEIAAAVQAVAALVPGPLVVTGHSAGGHLAAMMGVVASGAARVVPISPVAELAPMLDNSMNGDLHLDAAEVAAQSPARLVLRPDCSAHVWVGGQERPAFLWQARLLSENWACPWTVAPGRHHFDVIDDLADPESLLMQTLLGGL
ncbi:alpha/beta hydrolase [Rhodobacter ferrooxidans]|uniref:BD-FAE-like domain-containing protein n=1 Tax=Rhodobacter ferrooxidans TaxID=371731 RepID=C8S1M1_9RHOB|nr:alpha/beta hydrolase [Rhodobacter sp. SW2]EEW25194.1 conserved hypothetical protein [Rhodobacter sp. SW2]